jgi:hypothetical protein
MDGHHVRDDSPRGERAPRSLRSRRRRIGRKGLIARCLVKNKVTRRALPAHVDPEQARRCSSNPSPQRHPRTKTLIGTFSESAAGKGQTQAGWHVEPYSAAEAMASRARRAAAVSAGVRAVMCVRQHTGSAAYTCRHMCIACSAGGQRVSRVGEELQPAAGNVQKGANRTNRDMGDVAQAGFATPGFQNGSLFSQVHVHRESCASRPRGHFLSPRAKPYSSDSSLHSMPHASHLVQAALPDEQRRHARVRHAAVAPRLTHRPPVAWVGLARRTLHLRAGPCPKGGEG